VRYRIGVWDAASVLVVLATRWVVYALAPRSVLLAALAHREGGPDLTGALLVVAAVATALAAAVLVFAGVAVRERLALEGRRIVATPRLAIGPLLARFGSLFLVSSFLFAMTESYVHWQAGLGWHGLACLLGPVHREAIPVLAGLSLLTVAVHGAIEHLLAWARRLFAQLAAVRLPLLPFRPPSSLAGSTPCRRLVLTAAPRGPPRLFFVTAHSL